MLSVAQTPSVNPFSDSNTDNVTASVSEPSEPKQKRTHKHRSKSKSKKKGNRHGKRKSKSKGKGKGKKGEDDDGEAEDEAKPMRKTKAKAKTRRKRKADTKEGEVDATATTTTTVTDEDQILNRLARNESKLSGQMRKMNREKSDRMSHADARKFSRSKNELRVAMAIEKQKKDWEKKKKIDTSDEEDDEDGAGGGASMMDTERQQQRKVARTEDVNAAKKELHKLRETDRGNVLEHVVTTGIGGADGASRKVLRNIRPVDLPPKRLRKRTAEKARVLSSRGAYRPLDEFREKHEQIEHKSDQQLHHEIQKKMRMLIMLQEKDNVGVAPVPTVQKMSVSKSHYYRNAIGDNEHKIQNMVKSKKVGYINPIRVSRARIQRFLRPPNPAKNERPCFAHVNGDDCISSQIERNYVDRYSSNSGSGGGGGGGGGDNGTDENALICREWLTPDEEHKFRNSGWVELPDHHYCWLCHITHVTEYVHLKISERRRAPNEEKEWSSSRGDDGDDDDVENSPSSDVIYRQSHQVDPREFNPRCFLPTHSPDRKPTMIRYPFIEFNPANYRWQQAEDGSHYIQMVGMDPAF